MAAQEEERPPETQEAPPGPAAQAPVPVAPPPVRRETGDPRVDEATSRLGDLDELPITSHPEVFEYVHERLAEVLGDLSGHGQDSHGQDPDSHGQDSHGQDSHGRGSHGR